MRILSAVALIVVVAPPIWADEKPIDFGPLLECQGVNISRRNRLGKLQQVTATQDIGANIIGVSRNHIDLV